MLKKVGYQIVSSPVGRLLITERDGHLAKLWFLNDKPYHPPSHYWLDKSSKVLGRTKQQLKEYFEGERKTFDVPLFFNGTEFNKTVWRQLLQIDFGETASYMDVAKKINNPRAVRAVGLANNRNPIAIICPCHRVIGSNGKLVGFGGGLEKKDWLLRHENRYSGKEHQLELFEI
ncbi:methylated-DNA--[protein]-cysteine S-methyltransferase [Ulvibacterium sp.]|uniref:methylated-DNA--[protein]-cysteine S-methyltransferase n=1 Tax=Ulvibacterium sp. TaxID=2665914 RepID=UPI003BA93A65